MKPAINKADGIRIDLIDGLFMNRVMSSLSEDRFVSIKSALGAFRNGNMMATKNGGFDIAYSRNSSNTTLEL